MDLMIAYLKKNNFLDLLQTLFFEHKVNQNSKSSSHKIAKCQSTKQIDIVDIAVHQAYIHDSLRQP